MKDPGVGKCPYVVYIHSHKIDEEGKPCVTGGTKKSLPGCPHCGYKHPPDGMCLK